MLITSSIYTALSNGEQFNSFRKNSTEGWKGWNGSYYFQTYDVNGDGSKDLVASKPDRFSVALSGGETLNHGKKAGVQCNLKCVLVDVNNDGLPDLLKWTVSGNKTTFHVAPRKFQVNYNLHEFITMSQPKLSTRIFMTTRSTPLQTILTTPTSHIVGA